MARNVNASLVSTLQTMQINFYWHFGTFQFKIFSFFGIIRSIWLQNFL